MKVFISYRRDDSRDITAHISNRLEADIDVDRVFLDVAAIEPGSRFRQCIDDALNASDICLVMMGADWVGRPAEAGGDARIWDDGDFVRYEVAKALRDGKRVIPVLLNGAAMPNTLDLPNDVRAIAALDALFVRHESIAQDIGNLLDHMFDGGPRSPLARWLQRRPVLHTVLRSAVGLTAAVMLLITVAAVHKATTDKALNQTLGTGGFELLVVITLIAGALLPVWRLWRR